MLAFLVLPALFGGLGILVHVNRLRYERSVEQEMRALVAAPSSSEVATQPTDLPDPVERYRAIAVGERKPVRTLRIRHGGTFRLSPKAKVSPIRGEQLFTADPPGFVWTGRIPMARGIWIDARDMAVAGKGTMRVLLDDTVPIVDAHGPELDQGAALRLLAEMVWYPTALFDPRIVTWSAIDVHHARATLRFGERKVSGIFEFGNDGLPARMSAERFMDKNGMQPWSGVYRDYRKVSGMLVPFEAEVAWQLEAGPYTYAHWRVDSMEFDAAT